MQNSLTDPLTILITGGTSGLGLELVRLFLKKGCEVIATGRKSVHLNGFEDHFRFYKVDFGNLNQTGSVIKNICNNQILDVIINNAGILSPPDLMFSDDKLEYTFQVNFLSHLLLNEIIIKNIPKNQPLKIVVITSMVYRIADTDLISKPDIHNYKAYKAYSDSKLYLALMCKHLHEKYPVPDHVFFGFDPGVFSSGIFRMQKKWFRVLYRIAAPFMRSPMKVANRLEEIVAGNKLISGSVYDYRKRIRSVPVAGKEAKDLFWKDCYSIIDPFIS